jgi:uncharacterized protein (DUF58 family)
VNATNPLFSEAFLSQLEHLALIARRPVAGHLRGPHRSRRTGSGMIFSDYRPYSPGDDTRNLDWGTYMRLDRLILRLFEQEADLPIYIFLDASRSMAFGDKFDFARRLAAAIAHVGLINHDRVSLVGFADGVVQEMPAGRGRQQMWRTLHFLEQLESAGRTSLHTAVRSFFGARRTRGLIVVISDLLDRGGFEAAFQVLRRFRHEVFALHVTSPAEESPALEEEMVLVDAEEDTAIEARIGSGLLAEYRDAFHRYCTEIESFCRSHGWGYLRAASNTPLEQLLLKALREEGLLR